MQRNEPSRPKKLWILACALGVAALVSFLFFRAEETPEDSSASEEVRRVQGFARSGNVPQLAESVRSTDTLAAVKALEALGNVADQQARAEIERAVRDTRPAIREMAIVQYGRTVDRNNVAVLNSAVTTDQAPGVRAAAAKSLGQLRSWNGVESLLSGLNDPDPYVRRCSIGSLERILGVHYAFDPDGPAEERMRLVAQIRRDLPRFKRAYDASISRLEQSGSNQP